MITTLSFSLPRRAATPSCLDGEEELVFPRPLSTTAWACSAFLLISSLALLTTAWTCLVFVSSSVSDADSLASGAEGKLTFLPLGLVWYPLAGLREDFVGAWMGRFH